MMLTDAMREEVVSGLLGIFHDDIVSIILFGSVARREETSESDIDIAIIMKKDMDDNTKREFLNWSADMDLRYDKVFSIVDIQEEKLRLWGDVLPFYRNVQQEGVVLWKAV